MSRQPTRRRGLALAVAVAALLALPGAGQAVATQAGAPDEPAVVPDERILERQGRIHHQATTQETAAQGRVEPSRGSPAAAPRRRLRPEPPMGPGPQLGDQQVAPSPVRSAPAGARSGPVVVVAVAALLLAVGAASTWRARHRRPQPESTA